MDSKRLSLWHNTDFLKLWFGQTVSEFGMRITRESLPLIAVITLSATPSELSFLSVVTAIPILLLALFVGVWVDRFKRRGLMIFADVGRLVVLLIIPFMALHGNLTMWVLYVVAGIMSILSLLFTIAYRAYLPSLVSKNHLIDANGRLATSEALAEVGGPSVAGLLIQIMSAPFALIFDAITYLFSVISIIFIHTEEFTPDQSENRVSIIEDIREGGRIIRHDPVLRIIVITYGLRTFFGSFFGVLYALFAIRELGLTPAVLGFLVSAGGIGALFGSLTANRIVRRWGLGATLSRVLLISGGINLLILLAYGDGLGGIIPMLIPQIVGDAMMVIYFIHEMSLRQLIVPERALGRVNATIGFLGDGIAPLGAVVAGLLAGVIGVRMTLSIAVIGILLIAIWVVFTPLRQVEQMPVMVEV